VAVIFVIDDYAVHRTALAAFLRRRGHEVAIAADGAEALARLASWRPDLIVLDLWMPDTGGLAVLSVLRDAGGPPIPVIVTTAVTDAAVLARATDLGASRVLLKTDYSLTALADAIAELLPPPPPRT
jgi:two-component system response regulator